MTVRFPSAEFPMRLINRVALGIIFSFALLAAGVFGDELQSKKDPSTQPKPIPIGRSDMKQALEKLKQRKSRLPLPAIEGAPLGPNGRPVVYNGLARRTYLPASWYAADFGNDPAMTLTYVFKTQCFWVVSRGNNCHYCLGHQEHKLHDAGLTDRDIALLDYDWKQLDPMVRKGAEISRKITLEPHLIVGDDVAKLRPDFTDPQIIELVYTLAMFNSVNRWTDALGIPQDQRMRDKEINFLTEVDAEFQGKSGGLAAAADDTPARQMVSYDDALLKSEAAAKRAPRVELPSAEASAKMLQGLETAEDAKENWVRALASFPEVGLKQYQALKSMEKEGKVPPRLKAIIAWATARKNSAWTALRLARQRLEKFGVNDQSLRQLDKNENLDASEKMVKEFAEKLTEYPQRITDADIENLRKSFTDQQVAEIVYLIAAANMFDRFTETLSL